MPAPVKPVAPPQALRSNPDTFSANAELSIQYQWTALPNWIEASAEYMEEQAAIATAAALTGDVGPDISKALNYLRLNSGGTGLEYRTPAQTFGDLGDAASSRFDLRAISEPFVLWTHLAGCPIPDNSGTAKFIELTAGLTGAGQYNEGLLGSESVTGSFPLVEATAEIVVGPMAGQTVPLINTEEAVLRAGGTIGALEFDQMQRMTGLIRVRASRSGGSASGAFTTGTPWGSEGTTTASSAQERFDFDTANSPNARASATTDGETRAKSRRVRAYMRIV
jgi:hypothetical protein